MAMRIVEARAVVARFEECSKKSMPGTGKTPYHFYAEWFGKTLIADAVREVTEAQRTIARYEAAKKTTKDLE